MIVPMVENWKGWVARERESDRLAVEIFKAATPYGKAKIRINETRELLWWKKDGASVKEFLLELSLCQLIRYEGAGFCCTKSCSFISEALI